MVLNLPIAEKMGVQIPPVRGETVVGSMESTVNFPAEKNPEKVDAVGCKPTASIPFLQYGGDTQTRTGVELLQSSALPLGYVAIWITEAIACFCYHLLEQVTRLELATSTLARWRSTR